MKHFKTFFRKMFNKGGVLAVGIVCLYFQRRRYIPNVFGPISYGIISVGAIAVGRHIMMDLKLSEKPKDISDQISDCLLEEMSDKLQEIEDKLRKREIQERLEKETLEKFHKILFQTIKEMVPGDQSQLNEIGIFSQEFLQQLEKEIQLKPEELVLLQQYLKGFEVYLRTGSLDQGDVERSDDSDMEIINKEEIQTISGVE